jgi:hypothetical protein
MWNMQLQSAPAIFNLNLQYIIVQINKKKIQYCQNKKDNLKWRKKKNGLYTHKSRSTVIF